MRFLRVGMLVLMVIPILVTLGACDGGSGPPLHYVVPDGFDGRITFILDPNGVTFPINDGEYVINIPASGTLYVATFAPFNHWHKTTASYVSGKTLPVLYTPDWHSKDETVGLFEFYSSSSATSHGTIDRMIDFVGTNPEAVANYQEH